MHLPTWIIILLALMLASLVLLALLHFGLLRRLSRAFRREQRAISDREEVVSFLNRFAMSMVTTNDSTRWLQLVAGYVAAAIHARGLVIFSLDESNNLLVPVARTGNLPSLDNDSRGGTMSNRLLEDLHASRLDLNESRLGEVILGGNPILEHDMVGASSKSTIESFLAVPMSVDQGNIGVICVVDTLSGDRFSQDDAFLLQSLANQVALGSTLIRVYEELSLQQKMQQDLKLAREIQNSLLPDRPPSSRRLKINAINIPAREVSGDFYDFITLDADNVLVVIADASGKGVPACMLMAMCRSFLRTNAFRYRNDLEGLMQQLNRNLFSDTDDPQFITMACCLIDKKDNTIEYARAGHTELLIRTPSGEIQIISPEGPALGLLPDEFELQFDTFAFSWLPGHSILLFTDGITEALNEHNEEFGLERLIDVWKQQSNDPQEATEGILTALRSFTQANVQYDDQTMVVLSRN